MSQLTAASKSAQYVTRTTVSLNDWLRSRLCKQCQQRTLRCPCVGPAICVCVGVLICFSQRTVHFRDVRVSGHALHQRLDFVRIACTEQLRLARIRHVRKNRVKTVFEAMSSARSASSSTSISRSTSRSVPLIKCWLTRPGIPTMMCAQWASEMICGLRAAPPQSVSTFIL